ncbi:MAG: hypothetical protein JWM80_9 [Cyanobacteria bacterium RYN_339]|nr:hypothetical protein [Cyanobacteria bacterium RYN_339]
MNWRAVVGWLVVASAVVSGCAGQMPDIPRPQLGIDHTPAVLKAETHRDWSTDRVVSRGIDAARTAYRASQAVSPDQPAERSLLAFPTVSASWPVALGGGGDYITNSPAATFFGATVPAAITNQVFFLSRNGRFYKVDKGTGAQSSLNLGDTFTRTYITLSPSCTRAYCYSDVGKVYIVNTLTMAQLAGSPLTVNGGAGGKGIAVSLDPYTSRQDDANDDLYIPDNGGSVSRYALVTAPAYAVTFTAKYNLATGAAAVPKIEAPCLALGGVIYQGDGDGNVDVVDVNNAANNVSYGVGSDPIHTAPAIELYDSGLYPAPTWAAPAVGVPCFLFANVGRSCAWVNLIDDSVNYSQDLYVDDQDNTGFGKLLDYGYAVKNKKVTLSASLDGGNIDTNNANLPGVAPANMRDTTKICAASDDAVAGSRQAVYGYMRWSDPTALSANTTVVKATLTLKASATVTAPVPTLVDTSAYYQSLVANPVWSATAYTNAAGALQRPALGAAVTRYTSGGVKNGVVTFQNNKRYKWDVKSAFAGFNSSTAPGPAWQLALAMKYAVGAGVLYPGGIAPGGGQYTAPQFYNYTAATAGDRPSLQVTYAQVVHDPSSIELFSPPVIDPVRRKVYVLNGNHLFGLTYDYANPDVSWGDTDYDPATNPGGVAYTTYCRTYWGTLGGGVNGGGTWNGQNSFVCNMVAPALNYDSSAIYALNMYPVIGGGVVTGWKPAISKLTLPLDGTNRLVAGSPTFGTINTFPKPAWITNANTLPNVGGYYMVVDPYKLDTTTGSGIFFGLTNGSVYQYQP